MHLLSLPFLQPPLKKGPVQSGGGGGGGGGTSARGDVTPFPSPLYQSLVFDNEYVLHKRSHFSDSARHQFLSY